MSDDVEQPAGVGGARWATALVAVTAALLPVLLVFALWPEPQPKITVFPDGGDSEQQQISPLHLQILRDIYVGSQLDPDECKEDFTDTVGEPSSERLPFFFC